MLQESLAHQNLRVRNFEPTHDSSHLEAPVRKPKVIVAHTGRQRTPTNARGEITASIPR